MGVVVAPDQRHRVDRGGVAYRYASQVVAIGPQVPRVLPGEVRERGGAREHVEQVLGAEVGTDPLDREPELVGEVVVVDVPLAAGEHAGHPDLSSDEFGEGDRVSGGQRMAG